MRILVVDDDRASRLAIAATLRGKGYDVAVAEDGEQAWKLILENQISMVVSDWNMPVMDGLELCRKIRKAALDWYVYVILCTARGSREDLLQGLEAGADGFLSKPVDFAEMKVRIHIGERLIDLERALAEQNRLLTCAHQELSSAYERIREDVRAAAELQKNLLPPRRLRMPGARFEWLFRPAAVLAGDIFNFFRLDETHVGFYHLDVSGHGVPSAMLSVTLHQLLRPDPGEISPLRRWDASSSRYELQPPCRVLAELNERFQNHDDMYFTMVYGFVDARSRKLTLSQGGHPHPLWSRAGEEPRIVGSGGFPVGMMPRMEYDTIELELEVGDRLCLYSDGITECMSSRREQFGEDRLRRWLCENSSQPLSQALEALEGRLGEWKGGEAYQDDISVLAMEIVDGEG